MNLMKSWENLYNMNNTLVYSFKKILHFYYGEVDLQTIDKLSPNGLENFGIDDIKEISKELKLDFSYKSLNLEEIQEYMLPAIAIDKNKNAFVIEKLDRKNVYVYNPISSKSYKLSLKKLKGSPLEFVFVSKKIKEINYIDHESPNSKRWFFRPLMREWRSYVEIGVLTLFINIFGIAVSLFAMNVYNRVVPNFAVDTLFVLAVGVLVILGFDILLKSSRVYILNKVTTKLANLFEEELFRKTLTVQNRHDNYMVGTKTNLFREVSVVKDFFTSKILHILDFPFFFLSSYIIYLIDPAMVVVPLGFATVLLSFNFIMQYPLASLHKKSFKATQSKNAYLIEQLHGKDDLKISNAIAKTMHKWRNMINFYNSLGERINLLSAATGFVSYALVQAVSVVTISYGVYQIHSGSLNVGGLIAITILSSRAMVPIINLSNIVVKYKQIKESLDSLNKYWHLPTETDKNIELGVHKNLSSIEFKDVTFKYEGSQYEALKNVSFTIKKGEKVGIIGQTGSGKSTIVKLLLGLETPTSGKIFLDDMDSTTLHPVELRENISLMPQEPCLFSGSLKENLELNRAISKTEMATALKKSGLNELVKQSGGLDKFDVGERGKNLSVGQRHLVALARILLNNSPIVVLDEPTTGLDIGLENSLVKHLKESLKDKTLLVVSHRFAALDLVDRVILIDSGKIVADGKKDEILAKLQIKQKEPKKKSYA